jgi:hypothetical protein
VVVPKQVAASGLFGAMMHRPQPMPMVAPHPVASTSGRSMHPHPSGHSLLLVTCQMPGTTSVQ